MYSLWFTEIRFMRLRAYLLAISVQKIANLNSIDSTMPIIKLQSKHLRDSFLDTIASSCLEFQAEQLCWYTFS